MKKAIIVLILIISTVCFIGNSVLAESFTFNKDISFGMSKEDVIQAQNKKGALYNEENNSLYNYGFGDYYCYGEFAGLKLTHMFFSFDKEGKLNSAIFSNHLFFDIEGYNKVCNALTEKYGAPTYSDNYIKILSESKSAIDVFTESKYPIPFTEYSNKEPQSLSQYLVPIDGGYVNIVNILYSIHLSGMGMSNYGFIISYSFVSDEEYNNTLKTMVDEKNSIKDSV